MANFESGFGSDVTDERILQILLNNTFTFDAVF